MAQATGNGREEDSARFNVSTLLQISKLQNVDAGKYLKQKMGFRWFFAADLNC
jgi:hypothetical protein